MQKIVVWLFALIAFAIPIEHKYDRHFRHLSKELIPDGVVIPDWFDKKIFYYASDVAALALFCIVLFAFKTSIKKLLFDNGAYFLVCLILFTTFSIVSSPLSHYALLYTRLFQLCTAMFLFAAFSSLEGETKEKAIKGVIYGFLGMAFIQSIIGVSQYFLQHPVGLSFFQERCFSESLRFPTILVERGARWIFDRNEIMNSSMIVIRAIGTFPHPNIFGGFLSMTSLFSLYQFTNGKRQFLWSVFIFLQLFALVTTYSRTAFLTLILGVSVWFFIRWRANVSFPFGKVTLVLVSSLAILGTLFQDQLIQRGGIVNYNDFAKRGDAPRLHYQDIAFNLIKEKPLTGVGYTQFSLNSPDFVRTLKNGKSVVTRTSVHNTYLLIGSESGIFALLSYLAFIALLLWRALPHLHIPLLSILVSIFIGFLLANMTDFYLIQSQQGRLMFFLIAGLIASQIPKKEEVYAT